MSEYQYYEFIALDKTLSKTQIQELGEVSSRAEISSTRFMNVYNYGSFRGNVNEFMTRYFDAMVYVANWGTHRFMLRLPNDLVDAMAIERYCIDDILSINVKGDSVLLDFSSDPDDYGGWEEGEGWLSTLAPIRTELINGDLRALYLAWLLALQFDELYDDEQEPPPPPGLKNLSAALESLVEFLRLDPDLVAIAAETSDEQKDFSPDLDQWIAALPEAEKNDLLRKLIKGEDPQLGPRLLRRYQATSQVSPASSSTPRRTVAELKQAAQARRNERKQLEARRKAEARAKYLDELALREAAVWQQIEDLIDKKQHKSYADAVNLLKGLRELSQHKDKVSEFEQRVSDLRERHRRKQTFINQLDKVGL